MEFKTNTCKVAFTFSAMLAPCFSSYIHSTPPLNYKLLLGSLELQVQSTKYSPHELQTVIRDVGAASARSLVMDSATRPLSQVLSIGYNN